MMKTCKMQSNEIKINSQLENSSFFHIQSLIKVNGKHFLCRQNHIVLVETLKAASPSFSSTLRWTDNENYLNRALPIQVNCQFQRNTHTQTHHYHYHSITRITHKLLFLIVKTFHTMLALFFSTNPTVLSLKFPFACFKSSKSTNKCCKLVSSFRPLTFVCIQKRVDWGTLRQLSICLSGKCTV